MIYEAKPWRTNTEQPRMIELLKLPTIKWIRWERGKVEYTSVTWGLCSEGRRIMDSYICENSKSIIERTKKQAKYEYVDIDYYDGNKIMIMVTHSQS